MTKRGPKVVTPVKTGVQRIYNYLKRLDSGFRRNEGKQHFKTFYETINLDGFVKSLVGARNIVPLQDLRALHLM